MLLHIRVVQDNENPKFIFTEANNLLLYIYIKEVNN